MSETSTSNLPLPQKQNLALPLLNKQNSSIEVYLGRSSSQDTELIAKGDLLPEEARVLANSIKDEEEFKKPDLANAGQEQTYDNWFKCRGYAKSIAEFCAKACGGPEQFVLAIHRIRDEVQAYCCPTGEFLGAAAEFFTSEYKYLDVSKLSIFYLATQMYLRRLLKDYVAHDSWE